MARNDLSLSVGGDLSPLIRDIERLTKKKYSLNFQTKGNLAQPLGRITGQLGEFEKSLEASNARVLAFSASAGALFAFQRGIEAIFKSTIDLEKQLADINVILNISSKNLNKFGNDLFSVAKNTAQSFGAVSEAATELARQGLSVNETLRRTNDALILTRLSGMDAVSAVEALTAALNSFSRAAIDSTTFVSKLAAVDAAFAVSSADLAEAIKRVGSSAQEAGLDLDELIAAVTSAQQITARGGAVIGNSFKTIFTRIQRPRVLKALEELGIRTTDLAGKVRPAMQVMQDLANTFDTLTDAQKSSITQLVGGVFQVNVLKASLRDLNKEFSLYNNALSISASATDEAIRRNEELNKTVSATLNRTVENLRKTAAEMGGLTLAPVTKKLASSLNKALENFNIGEGIGGKLAEGILGGLGKFFSGGGLALAGVTLFRVFQRLVVQVSDAFRTLTGIGKVSENELLLQKQISGTLAANPAILKKISNGSLTISQVHKTLLHQIELENKALLLQKRIAEQIAAALHKSGVTVGNTFGEMIPPGGSASVSDHPLLASSSKGHVPKKSKGHIPNFSKRDKEAKRQELAGASYAKPSTRAVIDRMPGLGKYVRNTAEEKISGKVTGHKQDWINPPKSSLEGKQHRKKAIAAHGIDPYALRKGMVPNFAKIVDKDHLGGVQYDLVMKYALKKGHPIINVAGPGGSGKSYFAENLVSKERSRTEGQRAKGWLHRGKEAAASVAGKMGAYGVERKLRGHHSYAIKGGSYVESDDRFFAGAHKEAAKTGGVGGKPVNPKTMLAKFQKSAKEDENWSPGGIGSTESLIFLHSTEGMISKRAELFKRAQSNYLIARDKKQVEKLREKRRESGMGSMNRSEDQSSNVGTRSYEPLEEKMKEIGVGETISYVKNTGFIPNFASKSGVSIKGGEFGGPMGPVREGRQSLGHGYYDFNYKRQNIGRWEGDQVKDYEALLDGNTENKALQTSNVYGVEGVGKKLKAWGFKSPKNDLARLFAEGYNEIRQETGLPIYGDTTVSPFGAKIQASLATMFPGRFMKTKEPDYEKGANPPKGYPRAVFRSDGMIPNFKKWEPGTDLANAAIAFAGKDGYYYDERKGIVQHAASVRYLQKKHPKAGINMNDAGVITQGPNSKYDPVRGRDKPDNLRIPEEMAFAQTIGFESPFGARGKIPSFAKRTEGNYHILLDKNKKEVDRTQQEESINKGYLRLLKKSKIIGGQVVDSDMIDPVTGKRAARGFVPNFERPSHTKIIQTEDGDIQLPAGPGDKEWDPERGRLEALTVKDLKARTGARRNPNWSKQKMKDLPTGMLRKMGDGQSLYESPVGQYGWRYNPTGKEVPAVGEHSAGSLDAAIMHAGRLGLMAKGFVPSFATLKDDKEIQSRMKALLDLARDKNSSFQTQIAAMAERIQLTNQMRAGGKKFPMERPDKNFTGFIPNFRSAMGRHESVDGGAHGTIDIYNHTDEILNQYKSSNPVNARDFQKGKKVSIADAAQLQAFVRMGNEIERDPEASQRALAGLTWSEDPNAAYKRKTLSGWLGENTKNGNHDPVSKNMVHWWAYTEQGHKAWNKVKPAFGQSKFPKNSPAEKLVAAAKGSAGGPTVAHRGHAFEDILEHVMYSMGVKTTGAQGAMDFHNLHKMDKNKFAKDIGLRDSNAALHHGDAHIGSGHDVPHMIGKIIRDFFKADKGKIPATVWRESIAGWDNTAVNFKTEKEAAAAGSAELTRFKRFQADKIKLDKKTVLETSGQVKHHRGVSHIKTKGQQIMGDQAQQIPDIEFPKRNQIIDSQGNIVPGASDLGWWGARRDGQYIDSFKVNLDNVAYTDMTQAVETGPHDYKATAASVIRATPSKFNNLRKMIELGIISGNTPIITTYKKDKISLGAGMAGIGLETKQDLLNDMAASPGLPIGRAERYIDPESDHARAIPDYDPTSPLSKVNQGFIPNFVDMKRDKVPGQSHETITSYDNEGKTIGQLKLEKTKDGIKLIHNDVNPKHRGGGVGNRQIEALFEESKTTGLPIVSSHFVNQVAYDSSKLEMLRKKNPFDQLQVAYPQLKQRMRKGSSTDGTFRAWLQEYGGKNQTFDFQGLAGRKGLLSKIKSGPYKLDKDALAQGLVNDTVTIENLKTTQGHETGKMARMANKLLGRRVDDSGLYKKRKSRLPSASEGYVPNFANPLKEAVSREMAAGIPKNQIRIESSPKLATGSNPAGLAVTNKRDEPMGINQGIRRAQSMGIDPKTHGMARAGFVPNFRKKRARKLEEGPVKFKGSRIAKELSGGARGIAGGWIGSLGAEQQKLASKLGGLYKELLAAAEAGADEAKELAQEIGKTVETAQESGKINSDQAKELKGITNQTMGHYKAVQESKTREAHAAEKSAATLQKEAKDRVFGKEGKLARAGEKMEQNALTLSFVIPQVTETFSKFGFGMSEKGNALISELGGAISTATGVSGALASFGPLGKQAGVVVGGLLFAAQTSKAIAKSIQGVGGKFIKAAEESKEAFTKLQNSIQQYTSTFSDLTAAFENTETAPKTLIKLQRKLDKLLLDIPTQFRGDLIGLQDPKEIQSKVAEILEKQTQIQVQAEITGNLSKAFEQTIGTFGRNFALFGAAGSERGGMFRSQEGGALLGRTVEDFKKAIDFEAFSKSMSNVVDRNNFLGANANELADIFQNTYGASEDLAFMVRQLSSSELKLFQNELAKAAVATQLAMEQLKNLRVGRAEKAEELGLRFAQRQLQIAKERLELEKDILKELGGSWANFEKPKGLDDFFKKFQESLAVAANTSRASGTILTARHASTQASALRMAGVTPDIDLETGDIKGVFGDLLRDTVQGRMRDQVIKTQMMLRSTTAARDEAARNGLVGRVGTLNKMITAMQNALRNPEMFRRAADQQSREALGLPDLSKFTPAVKIPEGSKINLGGTVRDQGTVSLSDIFAQNRYTGQQQQGVLEDIKKTLLTDIDYAKTAQNLMQAGIDINGDGVNTEAEVAAFLNDANNLSRLSLDQLKAFVTSSDRSLLEGREFRAPVQGETPAERLMRQAQNALETATNNLTAEMRELNMNLENQRRQDLAATIDIDQNILRDALNENLSDLRINAFGTGNALTDFFRGQLGDNLEEMTAGQGLGSMEDVANKLEDIAKHLGGEGATIASVAAGSAADFNQLIDTDTELAKLNDMQVKVLHAILKTLSKAQGGGARQLFSNLQDINMGNIQTNQRGGFISNFVRSSPMDSGIKQSLGREIAAGVPKNRISIDSHPSLKGPKNPGGYGVINSHPDMGEPLGLPQAIRRSRRMGIDPKEHGMQTGGMVPNFNRYTRAGDFIASLFGGMKRGARHTVAESPALANAGFKGAGNRARQAQAWSEFMHELLNNPSASKDDLFKVFKDVEFGKGNRGGLDLSGENNFRDYATRVGGLTKDQADELYTAVASSGRARADILDGIGIKGLEDVKLHGFGIRRNANDFMTDIRGGKSARDAAFNEPGSMAAARAEVLGQMLGRNKGKALTAAVLGGGATGLAAYSMLTPNAGLGQITNPNTSTPPGGGGAGGGAGGRPPVGPPRTPQPPTGALPPNMLGQFGAGTRIGSGRKVTHGGTGPRFGGQQRYFSTTNNPFENRLRAVQGRNQMGGMRGRMGVATDWAPWIKRDWMRQRMMFGLQEGGMIPNFVSTMEEARARSWNLINRNQRDTGTSTLADVWPKMPMLRPDVSGAPAKVANLHGSTGFEDFAEMHGIDLDATPTVRKAVFPKADTGEIYRPASRAETVRSQTSDTIKQAQKAALKLNNATPHVQMGYVDELDHAQARKLLREIKLMEIMNGVPPGTYSKGYIMGNGMPLEYLVNPPEGKLITQQEARRMDLDAERTRTSKSATQVIGFPEDMRSVARSKAETQVIGFPEDMRSVARSTEAPRPPAAETRVIPPAAEAPRPPAAETRVIPPAPEATDTATERPTRPTRPKPPEVSAKPPADAPEAKPRGGRYGKGAAILAGLLGVGYAGTRIGGSKNTSLGQPTTTTSQAGPRRGGISIDEINKRMSEISVGFQRGGLVGKQDENKGMTFVPDKAATERLANLKQKFKATKLLNKDFSKSYAMANSGLLKEDFQKVWKLQGNTGLPPKRLQKGGKVPNFGFWGDTFKSMKSAAKKVASGDISGGIKLAIRNGQRSATRVLSIPSDLLGGGLDLVGLEGAADAVRMPGDLLFGVQQGILGTIAELATDLIDVPIALYQTSTGQEVPEIGPLGRLRRDLGLYGTYDVGIPGVGAKPDIGNASKSEEIGRYIGSWGTEIAGLFVGATEAKIALKGLKMASGASKMTKQAKALRATTKEARAAQQLADAEWNKVLENPEIKKRWDNWNPTQRQAFKDNPSINPTTGKPFTGLRRQAALGTLGKVQGAQALAQAGMIGYHILKQRGQQAGLSDDEIAQLAAQQGFGAGGLMGGVETAAAVDIMKDGGHGMGLDTIKGMNLDWKKEIEPQKKYVRPKSRPGYPAVIGKRYARGGVIPNFADKHNSPKRKTRNLKDIIKNFEGIVHKRKNNIGQIPGSIPFNQPHPLEKNVKGFQGIVDRFKNQKSKKTKGQPIKRQKGGFIPNFAAISPFSGAALGSGPTGGRPTISGDPTERYEKMFGTTVSPEDFQKNARNVAEWIAAGGPDRAQRFNEYKTHALPLIQAYHRAAGARDDKMFKDIYNLTPHVDLGLDAPTNFQDAARDKKINNNWINNAVQGVSRYLDTGPTTPTGVGERRQAQPGDLTATVDEARNNYVKRMNRLKNLHQWAKKNNRMDWYNKVVMPAFSITDRTKGNEPHITINPRNPNRKITTGGRQMGLYVGDQSANAVSGTALARGHSNWQKFLMVKQENAVGGDRLLYGNKIEYIGPAHGTMFSSPELFTNYNAIVDDYAQSKGYQKREVPVPGGRPNQTEMRYDLSQEDFNNIRGLQKRRNAIRDQFLQHHNKQKGGFIKRQQGGFIPNFYKPIPRPDINPFSFQTQETDGPSGGRPPVASSAQAANPFASAKDKDKHFQRLFSPDNAPHQVRANIQNLSNWVNSAKGVERQRRMEVYRKHALGPLNAWHAQENQQLAGAINEVLGLSSAAQFDEFNTEAFMGADMHKVQITTNPVGGVNELYKTDDRGNPTTQFKDPKTLYKTYQGVARYLDTGPTATEPTGANDPNKEYTNLVAAEKNFDKRMNRIRLLRRYAEKTKNMDWFNRVVLPAIAETDRTGGRRPNMIPPAGPAAGLSSINPSGGRFEHGLGMAGIDPTTGRPLRADQTAGLVPDPDQRDMGMTVSGGLRRPIYSSATGVSVMGGVTGWKAPSSQRGKDVLAGQQAWQHYVFDQHKKWPGNDVGKMRRLGTNLTWDSRTGTYDYSNPSTFADPAAIKKQYIDNLINRGEATRSTNFNASPHKEKIDRIVSGRARTVQEFENSFAAPQQRQTGGFIVPGVGSGDKVPSFLNPGDFVLNREATRAVGLQRGGSVPTLLEPGEAVIPSYAVTPDLVALNSAVPRFQTGGMVGGSMGGIMQNVIATTQAGASRTAAASFKGSQLIAGIEKDRLGFDQQWASQEVGLLSSLVGIQAQRLSLSTNTEARSAVSLSTIGKALGSIFDQSVNHSNRMTAMMGADYTLQALHADLLGKIAIGVAGAAGIGGKGAAGNKALQDFINQTVIGGAQGANYEMVSGATGNDLIKPFEAAADKNAKAQQQTLVALIKQLFQVQGRGNEATNQGINAVAASQMAIAGGDMAKAIENLKALIESRKPAAAPQAAGAPAGLFRRGGFIRRQEGGPASKFQRAQTSLGDALGRSVEPVEDAVRQQTEILNATLNNVNSSIINVHARSTEIYETLLAVLGQLSTTNENILEVVGGAGGNNVEGDFEMGGEIALRVTGENTEMVARLNSDIANLARIIEDEFNRNRLNANIVGRLGPSTSI